MDHDYIETHDIARRYSSGRLPADDVEHFEAHYLDCAECQRQIQEFDVLRQGFTELGAELTASVNTQDLSRRRVVAAWRPASFALAAALAAVAIVPVWMIARDAAPAGVAILPVAQLRDSGTTPQAAIRPADGAPFLLMLELDWPDADAYQVRILDAGGALRWQGEGLQPNYLDALTVSMPAEFLPPGVYRAEVAAQTPDDVRPVGDFPFRILPPE